MVYFILSDTQRPAILQTDNGSEFIAAALENLCKAYNVRLVHGSVGNPQSQGAVERCNRSIKSMPFSCCFYRGFGPLLWANLSTLCVAC